MTSECPNCGESFKRLGTHWAMSSSCEHPNLTQKQKEITTGLLMGDGWVSKKVRYPYLLSEMTSKSYLEYIDNEFGVLGTGVSLIMTAEESAQKKRDTHFSPNANSDNYSDMYRWHTRTHPEFNEFENWYSSGKKIWPDDIELTPTVLKHWYCGDGHWENKGTHNRIQIAMANEVENTEKVDRMFENARLPSPSNYSITERKDGGKICNAQFTVEQSKALFDYMGEPLPDFEYKWPERFK